MIITKDAIELSPEFPFLIMDQILYEKDNREDTFHWHSYCEITYIKRGHGYYYVNGEKYEVGEKDLIIFNNVLVGAGGFNGSGSYDLSHGIRIGSADGI